MIMKRIAISIFVLIAVTLGSFAQVTMRINLNDGKQIDVPVDNVKSVTWVSPLDTPTTPDISPSNVVAVDLGLPSGLKWANMNIGATSASDYGDYFAWGETFGYKAGKATFSEDTYKYYKKATSKDIDGIDVTIMGYTKYVRKSRSGEGYGGSYDDKTALEFSDDAAFVNWGGTWRMPTASDFDELTNNCQWEWVEQNEVSGYKVTSKQEGNENFIFFPAAGYRNVSSLVNSGISGSYWSSSFTEDESYYAYGLYFNPSEISAISNGRRFYGRSVRAVCP